MHDYRIKTETFLIIWSITISFSRQMFAFLGKKYILFFYHTTVHYSVPISHIINMLSVDSGDSGLLRLPRLVRILRIFRLFKLLRLFKLMKVSLEC